ncbi:hypothetical protein [Streptomyces sp. NPDC097981]|uniref:hypothetical protein n=1 Tax=Streptomyces sp. NPDC097981 TaxID=3155428 RepID=UPI00332621E6
MVPRTSKLVMWLPTALAVAFCAGLLWMLWNALDDYGAPDRGGAGTGTTGCAEALAFARVSLPPDGRNGDCERTGGTDGRASATGTFRMERDGVDAWLASFPQPGEPVRCPGPRPENYDSENEQCLDLVHGDPQPGRAGLVRLRISSEAGTTVKVRFEATGA